MAGLKLGDRRVTVDQAQQELQIANVTSVAEAAQRAVLRPLPEQLGPLKLGVVYLAAAAEARVGGDLYEVTYTESYGIRLIIGDVRGKGLGAVEVAADIIGRFREVAHGVGTLNEVAHRLDAGPVPPLGPVRGVRDRPAGGDRPGPRQADHPQLRPPAAPPHLPGGRRGHRA